MKRHIRHCCPTLTTCSNTKMKLNLKIFVCIFVLSKSLKYFGESAFFKAQKHISSSWKGCQILIPWCKILVLNIVKYCQILVSNIYTLMNSRNPFTGLVLTVLTRDHLIIQDDYNTPHLHRSQGCRIMNSLTFVKMVPRLQYFRSWREESESQKTPTIVLNKPPLKPSLEYFLEVVGTTHQEVPAIARVTYNSNLGFCKKPLQCIASCEWNESCIVEPDTGALCCYITETILYYIKPLPRM